MAVDYGAKRVGLAVTDPLQMIANPLTTVATKDIWDFLKDYLSNNEVSCLVVGDAKRSDGSPTHSTAIINAFVRKFEKVHPAVKVVLFDERYTSKMAQRAMIDAGAKKKTRQRKELIDTISAAIILQSFLESSK